MNLVQRAIRGLRKSWANLGGGAPYGSNVDFGMFASMMGWGGAMSDASMEVAARGATTTAICIGVLASRLAEPELVIEEKVGKGKWDRLEDDDTRYGNVMRVMRRPNPDEGMTALWMKFHASTATFGRAPLLTDYLNFGKAITPGRQFPREMRYLYAPAFIPQFTDYSASPTGFLWTNPVGGRQLHLRPDEVLLHVNPRLDNPWEGASLVARAAVFAVLQREMGKFHVGYFKNGARTGLVLESDQKITPEQMTKLKAEWREEHGNETGMAFATLFTHSGFKLKDLGDGQKDGDFPNLFRLSKEEIGGSFGIPPVFLNDYTEAALANIEEQTPILYEGALMPPGRLFTENMNGVVLPRFDPQERLRCRLDWDNVPAMKRLAWKRATAFVTLTGAPILTRNEAREMNNLPPLPDGDGLLVPFSMTDRGVGAVPDALIPEQGTAPKPKPETGKPSTGIAGTTPGGKAIAPLAKWIDTAERHAKRARGLKSMDRFVPSTEREFRSFFSNQETRLLAKLPAALKAGAGTHKDDSGDIFDEEFESEATAEILGRVYARVASTRGPEAIEEVGSKASDWLMDAPEIVKFLRENGYKMGKLITDTTGAQVKEVLAQGIANGQTVAEVTRELKAIFDVRRSDALRIARTEITRSYNFATREAWIQSDAVQGQEWLTAHDDKVRSLEAGDEFDHAAADATTADLDGTFTVSGESLEYPGDPAGSPGNTINCRCVTLPVLKSDEQRAYRIAPELARMFSTEKG